MGSLSRFPLHCPLLQSSLSSVVVIGRTIWCWIHCLFYRVFLSPVRTITCLLCDSRGATVIEYVLALALVGLLSFAISQNIIGGPDNIFATVKDVLWDAQAKARGPRINNIP